VRDPCCMDLLGSWCRLSLRTAIRCDELVDVCRCCCVILIYSSDEVKKCALKSQDRAAVTKRFHTRTPSTNEGESLFVPPWQSLDSLSLTIKSGQVFLVSPFLPLTTPHRLSFILNLIASWITMSRGKNSKSTKTNEPKETKEQRRARLQSQQEAREVRWCLAGIIVELIICRILRNVRRSSWENKSYWYLLASCVSHIDSQFFYSLVIDCYTEMLKGSPIRGWFDCRFLVGL